MLCIIASIPASAPHFSAHAVRTEISLLLEAAGHRLRPAENSTSPPGSRFHICSSISQREGRGHRDHGNRRVVPLVAVRLVDASEQALVGRSERESERGARSHSCLSRLNLPR